MGGVCRKSALAANVGNGSGVDFVRLVVNGVWCRLPRFRRLGGQGMGVASAVPARWRL
jgi:hypothetical protein